MTQRARWRSQPLVALTGVIGSWIAVRALIPAGGYNDVPVPPNVVKRVGQPAPVEDQSKPVASHEAPDFAPIETVPLRPGAAGQDDVGPGCLAAESLLPQRSFHPSGPARPAPPLAPPPERTEERDAIQPRARLVPFSPAPASSGNSRWSGDGWLLWRREGGSTALAIPGAGSYGASQAGTVLRYRLAHASSLRPRLYLLATTALDTPDREVATGIGVQPLAGVPLEILAEGRVGQFAGETRLRPAVLGVFGPPPQALPLNLGAEVYAQAGYVAGENATAFADGQMRLTRGLGISPVTLQAGAGIWGGAQEGLERLDAGPTLSSVAPVSEKVFARISVDWRERVAGDAEPGSGPVVTLSAGF